MLGLLDRPSESVGNPDPRASEDAVDAWIQGAYLPRVTEIVNAYGLDALEVMNEPNNDKLAPSSFALVVKRTYEHVRNVMGRASPAIISGGILNLYTGEDYYAPLARSRAFSDYRNAYGRWPLDGFGIHPYQNHTWTAHIGDLRGFLLGEMANVRSVLGELRDVPFWVTEFGWQNTCDCEGDALGDGYCGCPQESGACDDQVARYMTSAFSAFRDPSANVAAAFWYDYRDDEADRASDGASCRSPVGERFGLRKRQPEGYEAKPAWSAFQRIAGGSGGPTAPPAAGEPTGVGIFRAPGTWVLDRNRNGWDGDAGIRFSAAGDTPVVGDWNGDGRSEPGVFRNADGTWLLDVDGNGWSPGADRQLQFGLSGDVPIVGDWSGTGQARVGVFRNGELFLDLNGNGYDGELPLRLGQAGDKPVVGRWSGTARSLVGAWRPSTGMWFLDMNGNGWDGADRALQFGLTGDVPVTGAW
ncbi:hypothetical protein WME91_08180 [Sorangium sp. So ce269]